MENRIAALQIGMGWFPDQPGGLNRMYHNLMHHLPAAGVEVRGLVAADEAPALADDVTAFARRGASLPARWWGVRRAVRQVMSENRPQLVATHFALYTLSALDRLAGCPLVLHFHGPWALEGQVEGEGGWKVRFKQEVEQTVYRKAVRAIVLSEAFKSVLHERYGFPEERIAIVPGGVDVERFASTMSRFDARTRLGWPTDRPVVLSVRRLAPRMGLEDLIDAVGEVRRRVPDVVVMIAGQGRQAPALAQRVREGGLEEHVCFLGYVPDEALPAMYRAADLSIVPTLALEGFGLTTLESLAAGTPVLVTPVGGLPEVVQGLSPDLILDDSGPEALAEGLVAALLGRRQLPDAAACEAYTRTHFDWPVIAGRVADVYREVLS